MWWYPAVSRTCPRPGRMALGGSKEKVPGLAGIPLCSLARVLSLWPALFILGGVAQAAPADDLEAAIAEAGKAIQLRPEEWTPAARVALAQCLWGEAGGVEVPDHRIIPWVLLKRRNILGGRWTLRGMVLAYSAPMKKRLASASREARAWEALDRRELNQIQQRRFVQGLRSGMVEPKAMALHLRRHKMDVRAKWAAARWRGILDLVDRWAAGEIPDPCPAALHWDHPGAKVRDGLVRVDCGPGVRNRFYRPK